METQETQIELEEPPGHTSPHLWSHIPPAQWNDWRWQLANRLNTVADFAQVIRLTDDEIAGLSAPGLFRVDVTPYWAALMDPDDPHCPIRRQVMPTSAELTPFASEMIDSLGEDKHSPAPGAGLLAGPQMTIEPEHWRLTHQRSTAPHIFLSPVSISENGRQAEPLTHRPSNGREHI